MKPNHQEPFLLHTENRCVVLSEYWIYTWFIYSKLISARILF